MALKQLLSVDELDLLQLLQLRVSIHNGLKTEEVLLLLDLLNLLEECLQAIQIVNDEVRLLLQVHALLHERLVVLQEVLQLLIFAEEIVQHKQLVLSGPDEVLQHL